MPPYCSDSDPIPQRDEAILYHEGTDTSKALEYLTELSDESSLQVSTVLSNGMTNHSGPDSGPVLAENIAPEEDEGYLVATYDWKRTEDPTICPHSEIYVAFSEDITVGDTKGSELGNGAIVQGADEGTATTNLVKLAEEHL